MIYILILYANLYLALHVNNGTTTFIEEKKSVLATLVFICIFLKASTTPL